MGDLNINISNNGCDTKHLIDIVNKCNLTLTTTKPTRVQTTATLTGQILTNLSAQFYHVDIIQSHMSGHYAQSNDYKIKVTTPHEHYKEVREISETNINCLCVILNNEALSEILCQTNVN
jgi:hypothetical protein